MASIIPGTRRADWILRDGCHSKMPKRPSISREHFKMNTRVARSPGSQSSISALHSMMEAGRWKTNPTRVAWVHALVHDWRGVRGPLPVVCARKSRSRSTSAPCVVRQHPSVTRRGPDGDLRCVLWAPNVWPRASELRVPHRPSVVSTPPRGFIAIHNQLPEVVTFVCTVYSLHVFVWCGCGKRSQEFDKLLTNFVEVSQSSSTAASSFHLRAITQE